MPRSRRPFSAAPLLAVALAVLAAGCASAPSPRFHSLLAATASAAAPAPAATPDAPRLLVDLAPVGVPAGVDQPQWVVRTADDTLRLLEQERWVAPLREELRAALLDGLVRRWNAADIRTAAAPADTPGWRVRVDVQRFETVAGSGTWLDSSWSAVSTVAGNKASIACRSRLRESAGADPVALAAAHRQAVARLADQIGATLSSAGREMACPSGNAPP
jgi:uncharacterized lipoprotein YmbA